MINIYSNHDIKKIKKSSDILTECFRYISPLVKIGRKLQELDQAAYSFIDKNNAVPAFLGYRNYPASICASINHVVIHGIPAEQVLADGDIIGIDIGICLDNWYSDMAYTFLVGNISRFDRILCTITEEALYLGIAQAKEGNTVGDISHAVQTHVEQAGFSVVRDFIGHGIGRKLHEEPAVPNYGKKKS